MFKAVLLGIAVWLAGYSLAQSQECFRDCESFARSQMCKPGVDTASCNLLVGLACVKVDGAPDNPAIVAKINKDCLDSRSALEPIAKAIGQKRMALTALKYVNATLMKWRDQFEVCAPPGAPPRGLSPSENPDDFTQPENTISEWQLSTCLANIVEFSRLAVHLSLFVEKTMHRVDSPLLYDPDGNGVLSKLVEVSQRMYAVSQLVLGKLP